MQETSGLPLSDAALWSAAAAALPLLLVVRRLLFSRPRGRGRAPASPRPRKATTAGAAATPTTRSCAGPPYLAPPDLDDALIGGDGGDPSLRPGGPAATTLTFRAFAAPSQSRDGEEIPKVDLRGATAFVRTGRVKAFARRGAPRRLVLDVRARTLAVHAPRRARSKRKTKKKTEEAAPRADRGQEKPAPPVRHMGSRRASGIYLSSGSSGAPPSAAAAAKDEGEEDGDDPGGVDLDDDAWDPRHFENLRTCRLDDLASVAAVPPRHGGVVEVVSRGGKGPGAAVPGEETEPAATGGNQRKKPRSPRKRAASAEIASVGEDDAASTVSGGGASDDGSSLRRVELGSTGGAPEDAASSAGGGKGKRKAKAAAKERRDEFTFHTARDAAEFQRVVLALRTAGRDVACLYDALEAHGEVPPAAGEGDPAGGDGGAAAAESARAPPGVSFADAWHCLRDAPALRRGLRRLRSLGRPAEEERGADDLFGETPRAAADNAASPPASVRLGLADFFSLFVPPLAGAAEGSRAAPCLAPCAEREAAARTGADAAALRGRGIERHHQRLAFVAALRRRVDRAALYVRVFVWCAPSPPRGVVPSRCVMHLGPDPLNACPRLRWHAGRGPSLATGGAWRDLRKTEKARGKTAGHPARQPMATGPPRPTTLKTRRSERVVPPPTPRPPTRSSRAINGAT